jgi:dTMP kinase
MSRRGIASGLAVSPFTNSFADVLTGECTARFNAWSASSSTPVNAWKTLGNVGGDVGQSPSVRLFSRPITLRATTALSVWESPATPNANGCDRAVRARRRPPEPHMPMVSAQPASYSGGVEPDRPSHPPAIKGGFLIVFEGIDGGGKSTLAHRLVERLRREGWQVTTTREPNGETALGRALRRILKDGSILIAAWAESFLFEADRAQSYKDIIQPALAVGAIVVSDRGPFGTIAYQGYGRGLDIPLIASMNAAAWPRRADLVFIVDIEPALGLARKNVDGRPDRFEVEGLTLQERARAGYLAAAVDRGAETHVIDGMAPAEDVFEEVWTRTKAAIANAAQSRDVK